MSSRPRIAGAAACLAALVALAAVDADAGSYGRRFIQTPVNNCQPALPAFDGQIRKRPKAVQNEGTSTAFVTCAWTSQGVHGVGAGENPRGLMVRFSVPDGVTRNVSCTVVLGTITEDLPTLTVSRTVGAGAYQTITLTPQSFGRDDEFPHGLVSLSCALPPGMAINDSLLSFNEPVP